MPRSQTRSNPFYIALVLVGVVFFITACAYGVMTFRSLRDEDFEAVTRASGLMHWMRYYGGRILTGELVALAAATFGAMAYDSRVDRLPKNDRDSTTT
jgi:hypothetical protein